MVIKQLSVSTDLKSAYWKSARAMHLKLGMIVKLIIFIQIHTPQIFTQILLAYLFHNKY
jgi:hypothetical protein